MIGFLLSCRSRLFLRMAAPVFGLAITLMGCTEPTFPNKSTSGSIPARTAVQILSTRTTRGFEDSILQIESVVAGFGGMSINDEGAISAWLTDVTKERQLRDHLHELAARSSDFFVDSRGTVREIKVSQGQYAFSQLVSWKDAIRVGRGLGIRLLDADERLNRVRLGISSDDRRQAILEWITKRGIPPDAVSFEVYSGGFEATATVRDIVRPGTAGTQISHVWSVADTAYCTMGFNAMLNGQEYFLTAGHCTHNYTGAGATTFYQPKVPNLLGTEAINPAWNTTGCLSATTYCNTIDAALIAYAPNVSGWSKVAQTSTVGTGNNIGNLTIGSTYGLALPQASVSVGDSVYKTGRSSGSTKGVINGTCVDVDSIGPPPFRSLFCQVEAGIRVDGGDSGSPAYRFRFPLAPSYREPEGIINTKYLNSPEEPPKAYFSTIAAIQAALGSFNVSY